MIIPVGTCIGLKTCLHCLYDYNETHVMLYNVGGQNRTYPIVILRQAYRVHMF